MNARSRILIPVVLLVALVAVAGCKKKEAPPPPAETAPPAATAPAPTAQITATPSVISAGDQVVLSWRTTDATTVSIDGIGDVPTSGVKTVTPTRLHQLSPGGPRSRRHGRRNRPRHRQCAARSLSVPTNTMSAEDEFKANVQDAFFDYDTYDIRGDAAGRSGQGRLVPGQPSGHQGGHRRLLRRARLKRIQPGSGPEPRRRRQERTGHRRRGRQPHPRHQLRQGEALLLRVHRRVLAAEPPRRLHHGPVR